MKIEIIKKAWVINRTNLSEPWYYDGIYHGTRGQAKKLACIANDAGEYMNGEPLTFLNIKMLRCPDNDLIMYNGLKIHRYEIKTVKRNEQIKNLSDKKTYYVQDKRGYVGNSVLWWALNGNGYTTNIDNAHKYTKDEVQKNFINGRETDIIWESDHVDSIVRRHVDSQYLKPEFKI